MVVLVGNLIVSFVGMLLVVPATPTQQLAERITGGTDADIKDFPYQLQLIIDGESWCGGSIISNTWALTAAHCLLGYSEESLYVIAGSAVRQEGGQRHNVSKIIIHEKKKDSYSKNKTHYDIALIEVSEPFEWSDKVQPIQLAANDTVIAPDTNAVVTGWGYTVDGLQSHQQMPTVLQQVMVPVISYEECKDKIKPFYKNAQPFTERMICTISPNGNQGPCHGDSGGPLVVNGTQIGIVAWGPYYCLTDHPNVFMDVAEFRDWIKDKSGV